MCVVEVGLSAFIIKLCMEKGEVGLCSFFFFLFDIQSTRNTACVKAQII